MMNNKIIIFGVLTFLIFGNSISLCQEKVIREQAIWGDYISEKFERTVKVSAGANIDINHKYGKIEVNSWQKDEILIKGEKRVSSEDEKDGNRYISNIYIDIFQRINGVNITTEYPSSKPSAIKSFQVSYTITVPYNCSIRLENSFGDVEVSSIEGEVNISTSHSIIKTEDIRGDVTLTNKFGTVEAQNITGNAEIETSNGDIVASGIGGNFTGNNKFGNIEASNVDGTVDVRNSNSNIDLKYIKGRIEVRNSFGKISLYDTDDDIRVTSSNGDIDVTDVEGRVELSGSYGTIKVEKCNFSVRIESKNSSVQVNDIQQDVDINNSFGAVICSNINNKLTIDNSNDAITVWNVKGETIIRSKFGRIDVHDIQNSLYVDNSNSPVSVKNITGAIDIGNTFSLVEVISARGDIKIDNRNGNVELSGLLPDAEKNERRIRISTTYGIIKIFLPGNTPGYVTAETTHGEIYSDFSFEREKYGSTVSARGSIGEGDWRIDLETRNSSIYIKKE